MRLSSGFRAALVAVAGARRRRSVLHRLRRQRQHQLQVIKAGFVVGGSGGSGTLNFHGRSYRLGIGGISYGFTFGASETRFHGTVSNIHRASDVAGVYAAGNVGAAVGRGAQAIVLTNQHGAVLTLTGKSVGAIVSADLNGLAVTVK